MKKGDSERGSDFPFRWENQGLNPDGSTISHLCGFHQDLKSEENWGFLLFVTSPVRSPSTIFNSTSPCLEGSFCISFKIHHQLRPTEAFSDTFNSALASSTMTRWWHGPLGQHLSKSLCASGVYFTASSCPRE